MSIEKQALRKSILARLGASEYDVDLLLDYNSGIFNYSSLEDEITFPMEDELFIKSWTKYVSESESLGVFPVIKKACPQLNFPINDKVPDSPEYKDAVLYANLTKERLQNNDLGLKAPENIQMVITSTDAGHIPMLYVPERSDFDSFLRAMQNSNTEAVIPPEITSEFIRDFRNAERISIQRDRFTKKKNLMNLKTPWRDEYNKLLLRKELYLDSFIMVYGGNASTISAESMGFAEDEWQANSIVIGREKEALRYYMKRIFQVEKRHPYVEFIAYYNAIKIAFGEFSADKMLKLMFPAPDSNIPVCGIGAIDEDFKPETCEIIKKLITKAANNLEDFEKIYSNELDVNDQNIMLISLTYITFEELASSIEPLEKIYFSLSE